MDIFDEEDLLAIANDDDSSSHGGSDDSSSKSEIDADGCDEEMRNATPAAAAAAAAAANPDTDDDSDDSDDGFLDSWLTDSKKQDPEQEVDPENEEKSPSNDESAKEHAGDKSDISTENDVGKQEEVTAAVSSAVDESTIDEQTIVCNQDSVKINLGQSALTWILNHNSKKRTSRGKLELIEGAIIGIQRQSIEEDQVPSEMTMELKKGIGHGKAVFTETTNDLSAAEPKQQRGDITSCASSHDRRKTNALIDCLARYDHEKKCYVLEMIDMAFTGLQPISKEDAAARQFGEDWIDSAADTTQNARSTSKQTEQTIVDPRLLAKRAEAQVKKLKRAKRKTISDESDTKKAKTIIASKTQV